MTPDEIKHFWTEQAHTFGSLPDASWSDVEAMALERRRIGWWITTQQRSMVDRDPPLTVTDLGCGNGLSTLNYAMAHPIQIHGIDYVPEMIDTALQQRALASDAVQRQVTFSVGDVLDPDLSAAIPPADVVICTRVLINLGSWAAQKMALAALAPLVVPGGLLLLSEATMDGFVKLSQLRAEYQLPALTIPRFNTYLSVEDVLTEARYRFHVLAVEDFASSYYVLTRVIKPILARVQSVDAANPHSIFNQWAAHVPAAGAFGIQKLIVLQRPDPWRGPMSPRFEP